MTRQEFDIYIELKMDFGVIMGCIDLFKDDFDKIREHLVKINSHKISEPEMVSSCCSASVIMADPKGHGKCKECGENCTSIETE